ncbi:MAG: thioredoxin family protein [Methanosphaera sp.]|uniref:thioredoxin family protein n=1 Tax=Methanosphaera sp. TaxID=2666342 RepID=UPI0025CB91BE|nr:thioredoxin family protein [Methanosphaera sp.]MDD6534124.1 thioredoxin family protein [Methanosphaera sp.]MDY3956067.1 thioredoxin family protein [Methanosphaera sp.]
MKKMVVKLEVYTSQTCPFCPRAVAAAEKVVEKFGDQVEYEHLDVAENMDKVQQYEIMSVPTVIIDGEVAFVGAPTARNLAEKVKEKLGQ